MNIQRILTLVRLGSRLSGRRKSPRVILVIVALVVAYAVIQPMLEKTGGNSAPTTTESPAESPSWPSGRSPAERPGDDGPLTAERPPAGAPQAERPTESRPSEGRTGGSRNPAGVAGLREVGRQTWESPAGLRYRPGSAEGHRLRHILRHASDQPGRAGSHGVFDGEPDEIFALLDEAYKVARSGGRRVRARQEDSRTVYEVDMQRRIGFVGGESGNRRGHPPARWVRMVLEDRDVITAFPFAR